MEIKILFDNIDWPKDEWAMVSSQVLKRVFNERKRQEEKWGPTSYPFFSVPGTQEINPLNVQLHLGIPSAQQARDLMEEALKKGKLSYSHILLEELAEAMEETHDLNKLEEELIQVTAVLVASIEDLQKKKALLK